MSTHLILKRFRTASKNKKIITAENNVCIMPKTITESGIMGRSESQLATP